MNLVSSNVHPWGGNLRQTLMQSGHTLWIFCPLILNYRYYIQMCFDWRYSCSESESAATHKRHPIPATTWNSQLDVRQAQSVCVSAQTALRPDLLHPIHVNEEGEEISHLLLPLQTSIKLTCQLDRGWSCCGESVSTDCCLFTCLLRHGERMPEWPQRDGQQAVWEELRGWAAIASPASQR